MQKTFLLIQETGSIIHNARDSGSVPGSGRSPGVGSGKLLQYSSLENPMAREDWRANNPSGREESDTVQHIAHTADNHEMHIK